MAKQIQQQLVEHEKAVYKIGYRVSQLAAEERKEEIANLCKESRFHAQEIRRLIKELYE